MNTSGLLQSKREALRASLTLQETRSFHGSINLPKIEIHFLNNTALRKRVDRSEVVVRAYRAY